MIDVGTVRTGTTIAGIPVMPPSNPEYGRNLGDIRSGYPVRTYTLCTKKTAGLEEQTSVASVDKARRGLQELVIIAWEFALATQQWRMGRWEWRLG